MAKSPRGILTLKITDKDVLYQSFMPFLKNGGLFVPTTKSYKVGDDIFFILNLMGEPDKIPVAGTVVWVTPKGAQENQSAGIGVHFSNVDGVDTILRDKIERYLIDSNQNQTTYTL